MTEPRIALRGAHFQLTGRCNLHCQFCGQAQGMLADDQGELTVEHWLDLARQVRELGDNSGTEITLWGGEPLLYAGFSTLAQQLKADGFKLATVTNGTLIDRMPEVLGSCLDQIHVSIDGWGATHDAVRGQGTFEQVRKNVELLRHRKGKLIFLTTISEANLTDLPTLIDRLAELDPDEIILQQLIYLSAREIANYRDYSRTHFGYDYPELEAWCRDDDREYLEKLKSQLALLSKHTSRVPVRFTPHRYPNFPADTPPCQAQLRRVHIRHDGKVGFCTDYFGFQAGDIQQSRLSEILQNESTKHFRVAVQNGNLPICDHCPWRLQRL